MKFLILVVGLIISADGMREIRCIITNDTWTVFNGEIRICNVKDQSIDSLESRFTLSDKTVEALHIKDNKQVKVIPEHLSEEFPALLGITVSNCSVKSVTENNFKNLVALEVLVLAYNEIEEIAKGTFNDNLNLKYLNLVYNQIKYLQNDLFNSLHRLTYLSLNNNQIGFVDPKTFDNLINLETFRFQYNQLEIVEENLLRNCRKLKEIKFNSNKIKFLSSKVFSEMQQLNKIDLSKNVCIDSNYIGTKRFNAMKLAIDQHCSLKNLGGLEQELLKRWFQFEAARKIHQEKDVQSEKLKKQMKTVQEENNELERAIAIKDEMLQELRNLRKALEIQIKKSESAGKELTTKLEKLEQEKNLLQEIAMKSLIEKIADLTQLNDGFKDALMNF